jgi:hypothetical protein
MCIRANIPMLPKQANGGRIAPAAAAVSTRCVARYLTTFDETFEFALSVPLLV